MLRDPETLPAIMAELLRGRLGDAIRESIGAAGAATRDELEAVFYEPDAPIHALTPPCRCGAPSAPGILTHLQRPRVHRWTMPTSTRPVLTPAPTRRGACAHGEAGSGPRGALPGRRRVLLP